jgi:GT2 family glycosyltransferase
VHKDWDKAMIAWLQARPQIALVGYQGCYLNEEAQGEGQGFGYEIDFVSGWSMAIPRSIIQDFGLFDETNLQFAYGEDSDLCLRLKEEGYQIYAMHLELAEHFGNRTVKQLVNEGFDLHTSFRRNHEYLKNRWLCKK